MLFDWDPAKAKSNEAKHNVSFTEAASVFDDSLAALFDDEDHSVEELREIIVGHSEKERLLVVSFTERDDRIGLSVPPSNTTRKEGLRGKPHRRLEK
jgi:uncharacterized DUF497 family protein